jgi:hypothetical protein
MLTSSDEEGGSGLRRTQAPQRPWLGSQPSSVSTAVTPAEDVDEMGPSRTLSKTRKRTKRDLKEGFEEVGGEISIVGGAGVFVLRFGWDDEEPH